ncbi:hypothetical protein FI667_g4106, partial [Globisporangium splendens]
MSHEARFIDHPIVAVVAVSPILCDFTTASGLGALNHSAICVKTEEEIHALMLNQDQLASGVEGNVIIPNDCKALVKENIMLHRSAEAQKALCDNSCYATLSGKYKILLDNNCFSKGDSDEEASGRLFAAAYQLACQTTIDGEYCVPMLADLVANAGTKYDLCSDIVKDMGCCFQSYRQYMLFGTTASVQALDEAQKTCTADGVKDWTKSASVRTISTRLTAPRYARLAALAIALLSERDATYISQYGSTCFYP